MDLLNLTETYFEVFSNQDLDSLSVLFSDDVTLKDWENDVAGKDQVLEVVKGIFAAFSVIKITPSLIACQGNTVMAEIVIRVDDSVLEVVDVIEYKHGKIQTIRAYKN